MNEQEYLEAQYQSYLASNRDEEVSLRCFLSCISYLGIPGSYLDIGCGSGHLVKACSALAASSSSQHIPSRYLYLGLDLNVQPIFAAGYALLQVDLRKWNFSPAGDSRNTYELVTCWEVAEHLPGEINLGFCKEISKCVSLSGLLLFSAAAPGQGGHGHINEREDEEWINDFRSAGLEINYTITKDIRYLIKYCSAGAPWYANNMLAFVKKRGT